MISEKHLKYDLLFSVMDKLLQCQELTQLPHSTVMGTQGTATTHTHNAGNDTEHIHYNSVAAVVTKKDHSSSTKALKILNQYDAKCGAVDSSEYSNASFVVF